ncbi:hypothetical protein [Xenorhabdus hominickii]|uniref:Uncharacterized protein n=1 Tax=Xenorhabdus hominickii TaxID=351679 RepID=A0A2G0PZ46_XENHO|nr:hypothetical protein [Xenorhabdus hominickii]AOM42611.1 hypothetical protein A9255_19910 [Xenorhabdus hominickii]PHM52226.1 hypothetical protein Xhom_04606 [Xenorhabdus hominickii]PHM53966.1 hypothetical protein Xhom_03034 [Xenorhabdus hominickii]
MNISMQRIDEMAEEIISELFADGKTPMEQFGINWKQAERLDSRNEVQLDHGRSTPISLLNQYVICDFGWRGQHLDPPR